MKFLVTISFLLTVFTVYCQHSSKQIKTLKKYQGKKLVLIEQYDKNGNCYFEKSDSLDEPQIIVTARDFDSSNRITRIIYGTSGDGFSVTDIKQEPFLSTYYHYKKHILYHPDTIVRKLISKISTKEELENTDSVKALLNTHPYLRVISFCDAQKNKTKDIYFEENGDTNFVQLYHYNQWNKEEYAGNDTYETFHFFDTLGNEIKKVFITSFAGEPFTTRTTHYKYSSVNQLIEEIYDRNNTITKSTYGYDAKNQLIEEKVIAESDSTLTLYKYDKHGNEIEEKMFDLKKNKDKPEYIYRTVYEYW